MPVELSISFSTSSKEQGSLKATKQRIKMAFAQSVIDIDLVELSHSSPNPHQKDFPINFHFWQFSLKKCILIKRVS